MYQDKDKNMLFTNKILKTNRIFPTQNKQNFRLRTLIMIFDRLPQVYGQYKSSLIRPCHHECYKDHKVINCSDKICDRNKILRSGRI